MSRIVIKKVGFKGWANCISLTNDIIEVIVTTDVGPRIIYYGFKDSHNEFYEETEQIGTTGGDEWKIYGGHRLWHSPEVKPRTYALDNEKVNWRRIKNGIRVTQPIESLTGLVKEMDITLCEETSGLIINHKIKNAAQWDIAFALWALTVMAPGGREIIPEITEDTVLLPNRSITLWPYTKMNDRRLTWGDSYIMLDQDINAATPVKIGLPVSDGWAAYINKGHMFVKMFDYCGCCEYPDNGCSYETYTNSLMLEMESLSPMTLLPPGETAQHLEKWHLFDNVIKPEKEGDIVKNILPMINRIRE